MHIYSFFIFFLSFPLHIFVCFIFIALFPTGHLALALFSSCALVNFILVDIIYGFLCSLGQSIVLYVGLFRFWLWVHMYMCIFSHTFYCCYKALPLCWAFAVLWSFLFFISFFFFLLPFSFLFFIILIFKSIIYFSTFIPLFAFPIVLFPLQLIFHVYKASLSTSI